MQESFVLVYRNSTILKKKVTFVGVLPPLQAFDDGSDSVQNGEMTRRPPLAPSAPLRGPPPACGLPHLPCSLARGCEKTLTKHPRNRHASAETLDGNPHQRTPRAQYRRKEEGRFAFAHHSRPSQTRDLLKQAPAQPSLLTAGEPLRERGALPHPAWPRKRSSHVVVPRET